MSVMRRRNEVIACDRATPICEEGPGVRRGQARKL